MAAFHGREREMAQLLARVQSGAGRAAELVVLYGRRRVGKTFLLQTLMTDLRRRGDLVVYHPAVRESADRQRRGLKDALTQSGVEVDAESWASLWRDVLATDRPLTLLLDEVPYHIASDDSWATSLQNAWDAIRFERPDAPVTIVLTGSAISTMTNLVSSRGALFERPSSLMRLDPFDLHTAATFIASDDPTVAIEAYTACDGYPLLLERWDPRVSAADNLRRLAGDPVAPLTVNASTMLLDLGDFDATQRVLGAIGRGAHRPSEIAGHAGQRVERPMAVLERSGLIRKHQPISDATKKTQRIELTDNYLRFWFRLIEPNQQLIDGGQGAAVLANLEPAWNNLVARCFEDQARHHAARQFGPELVVGEWWTNRPAQAQLDVVAMRGNRWALAGEAKWKDRFNRADLAQLERNLAIAGTRARDVRLATWSKFGSVDDLVASRPDISHFTARDVVFDP